MPQPPENLVGGVAFPLFHVGFQISFSLLTCRLEDTFVKRRSFLSTASALTTASIAGCLSTDNTPTPTEQRSNPSPSNSSRNEEQRQEIVRLYNNATGKNNQGIDNQRQAIDAYENEKYDRAASLHDSAESKHVQARNTFSDALNIALEIGHEEAQEICEEAVEFATLYRQAAQYGLRASEEASNGNISQANEFTDRYNQKANEANQLNPRSPDAVANILNIDNTQ